MASSSGISRSKVSLISFCLFCCSLFLTAYSSKHPQVARAGYILIAEVYRPFQLLVKLVSSRTSDLWYGYLYLVNVQEENSELRKKLQHLETEIVQLREVQAENVRISKILGFVNESHLKGTVGRIIGYSPSDWLRTVVVNKGSSEGVETGMAVVERGGVVGQVIEVSLHTARVILANDVTSGVDALVQESRARGVISGGPKGRYIFKYVAREQDVKVGDRVVTSGIGGVYPHGLLLGVVVDIKRNSAGLFQEIEVEPAVDFQRLEEVFIVSGKEG